MTITVAKLRALLAALPDDTLVYRADFELGVARLRGVVDACQPEPDPFTDEPQPSGVVLK